MKPLLGESTIGCHLKCPGTSDASILLIVDINGSMQFGFVIEIHNHTVWQVVMWLVIDAVPGYMNLIM